MTRVDFIRIAVGVQNHNSAATTEGGDIPESNIG